MGYQKLNDENITAALTFLGYQKGIRSIPSTAHQTTKGERYVINKYRSLIDLPSLERITLEGINETIQAYLNHHTGVSLESIDNHYRYRDLVSLENLNIPEKLLKAAAHLFTTVNVFQDEISKERTHLKTAKYLLEKRLKHQDSVKVNLQRITELKGLSLLKISDISGISGYIDDFIKAVNVRGLRREFKEFYDDYLKMNKTFIETGYSNPKKLSNWDGLKPIVDPCTDKFKKHYQDRLNALSPLEFNYKKDKTSLVYPSTEYKLYALPHASLTIGRSLTDHENTYASGRKDKTIDDEDYIGNWIPLTATGEINQSIEAVVDVNVKEVLELVNQAISLTVTHDYLKELVKDFNDFLKEMNHIYTNEMHRLGLAKGGYNLNYFQHTFSTDSVSNLTYQLIRSKQLELESYIKGTVYLSKGILRIAYQTLKGVKLESDEDKDDSDLYH